jgi:hypothetical protein
MTSPEMPPETEAIVLKVLGARVKDAEVAARKPLEALYADGEKRVIRSPLGDAKLGTVYRTDPAATWQIVDRQACAAYLSDDPGNVEYVDEIVSDAAAVEVLRVHAPELLARVERVKAAAFQVAVAAAKAGELVPGVERVKPSGSLVVKPDLEAAVAIEALIDAKWITYDGRRLELPAGASVEPSPPVNVVCPACAGRFDRKATLVRDGKRWHTACANIADAEQDVDEPTVEVAS